jgi:hypothetical protein
MLCLCLLVAVVSALGSGGEAGRRWLTFVRPLLGEELLRGRSVQRRAGRWRQGGRLCGVLLEAGMWVLLKLGRYCWGRGWSACIREREVVGCCGEGGDGCGRRNREQRVSSGWKGRRKACAGKMKLWPGVRSAEEVKMKANVDGKGDQVKGWTGSWLLLLGLSRYGWRLAGKCNGWEGGLA